MNSGNGLSPDELLTVIEVVNTAATKSIENTNIDDLSVIEGFLRNIVLERPVLLFMSAPNVESLVLDYMHHVTIQPWIIDFAGYFVAYLPNNRIMLEAVKEHMATTVGIMHYEMIGQSRNADYVQLAPKKGVLDTAISSSDARNTFNGNIWILALAALNVFGDYQNMMGTINSLRGGMSDA